MKTINKDAMKMIKQMFFLILFLLPFFVSANNNLATVSFVVQNEKGVENASLKVFPNPVKENKFRVQSSEVIKEIHLHNIAGQETKIQLQRFSDSDVEVHLSDNKPGIYLVTVLFENKPKQVKRIVVN